ncbi:uncharacterized protein ZBAI_03000 [Zygosaccharomyces bailii ISA1307]|nr:uncharacterized protein ZBAI_03000 [Zygosaccharomyces bailii ISA1307]
MENNRQYSEKEVPQGNLRMRVWQYYPYSAWKITSSLLSSNERNILTPRNALSMFSWLNEKLVWEIFLGKKVDYLAKQMDEFRNNYSHSSGNAHRLVHSSSTASYRNRRDRCKFYRSFGSTR